MNFRLFLRYEFHDNPYPIHTRELEDAHLVERCVGGYRTTPPGRLALSIYEDVLEDLEGLGRCLDALASLPPDAPLHPSLVENPSVALASGPDPRRATRAQRELIERATTQRALAPRVFPEHVEMYAREIDEGSLTGEFVVSQEALDLLVSNFPTELDDTVASERATIRWGDSLPPYGLSISETPSGPVVGLLVFSASGTSAFLETESSRAVEWAENLFERHWNSARSLTD